MFGVQVDELKVRLKDRKLSPYGLKAELAQRLKEADLCSAPNPVGQARPPASEAAGSVDPGDTTTARKVSIMHAGFAKCLGR